MRRGYHPPLTITRRALLVGGSDTEFRRLIYRLIVVEERLRRARDFLGRRIGLTGPQYTLLITVAYLQGESGIAVRALAKNLRVSSAFITAESQRLIQRGLLAKAERDCFVGASLVAPTNYAWRINGRDAR